MRDGVREKKEKKEEENNSQNVKQPRSDMCG